MAKITQNKVTELLTMTSKEDRSCAPDVKKMDQILTFSFRFLGFILDKVIQEQRTFGAKPMFCHQIDFFYLDVQRP